MDRFLQRPNTCYHFVICMVIWGFAGTTQGLSQQSFGGMPYGLMEAHKEDVIKSLKSGQVLALNDSDIKQLGNIEAGAPLFAIPVSSNTNPLDHINWNTINGEQVAWAKLDMADGRGMSLLLENYQLGRRERLFFYDPTGKQIHGAYTHDNNLPSGKFITDVIRGREVVMEFVRPSHAEQEIPFSINKIYKVIHDDLIEQSSMEVDTGFMASMACHENINCSLGENSQTEKQSVVRVMMVLEEGLGWCTGALMNNTNQDRSPLVLSAFHCQDGFTPIWDLWRFDFNFETDGCATPTERPSHKSMQGCSYLAGRQETDFILLRLNENVPTEYNPYFAGWDKRGDYEPIPTHFIHHPAGDIKKISVDTDDLRIWASSTNWDNDTRSPPGSHFRLNLENGNHEPGSSGGPLFDTEGRVVAQLHGGNTNEECTLTRAYFGRLSESWDNGDTAESRLMEWLDPAGTGVDQLDGLGSDSMVSTINISGQVETQDGAGVSNVMLSLSGETSATLMTAEDGRYTFSDLPADGNYTITLEKNIAANNGLSVSDLSAMVRHILGLRVFESEIQELAGDVNNSGSVSASDLVEVQQVILGLKDQFRNASSWEFLPASIEITNGTINQSALRIIAYKKGDVNFSADPKR